MIDLYNIIKTCAADLILPDLCAVCMQPLVTVRSKKYPRVPLCNKCAYSADSELFIKKYPNMSRCMRCGYPLTSEMDLCSRCREKEWNFTNSSSLFIYADIIKELIRAYKFDNLKLIADFFAFHIQNEYSDNYEDSVIVPVPCRPRAKKSRGWDQIEVICRILNNSYNLPVSYLLKRKNGPAQKTLSYQKRLTNLENQISIKKSANPPEKVLLFDDVFTTGATMDYCSKLLISEGIKDVRCITLAIDL